MRDARPCAGGTGRASPQRRWRSSPSSGWAPHSPEPWAAGRTPMARCPRWRPAGRRRPRRRPATPLDAERQAALDRLEKKAQEAGAPHRAGSYVSNQFPASFGPRRPGRREGRVADHPAGRGTDGLPAARAVTRRGRDRRRGHALDAAHARDQVDDGQGNPIDEQGPTASRRRPRQGLQPVRGLAGQHGRAQDGGTRPSDAADRRRRRRPRCRRVREPSWWRRGRRP